jgi:hypothetical protein
MAGLTPEQEAKLNEIDAGEGKNLTPAQKAVILRHSKLKEGEQLIEDEDGNPFIKKKLPGGVTSIRQPMHPDWYNKPLPQPKGGLQPFRTKEQKKKAPEPEPAMGRPGRRF